MIPDAEVLARLNPHQVLRIDVEAGALYEAVQAARGGPDELSSAGCARFIGRHPKWWRSHAEKLAGWWREEHPGDPHPAAYLDETGHWRFRNQAARDYLAAFGRKVETPLASAPAPRERRTRRGPRRAHPAPAPSR